MTDYLEIARRALANYQAAQAESESWAPGSPIIEKTPEPELPKPPKPSSGSFGSAPLAISQKIGQPERQPERVELTGPEMAQQVSRWLSARCARSRRAWGAEKFLFRDYMEWCQQHSQPAVSPEQFAGILSESFSRESGGYQGLCLRTDWEACKGSGTRRVQ
jgi:hypothetical protein